MSLDQDSRPTLTGREVFSTGGRVADFWRWAMNDLQMNTTRGFLAEYLVACAVDSPDQHRFEWAPYDVEGADGTRLEVKSSGYLQSWNPGRPSTPRWSFGAVDTTRQWSDKAGSYVPVDPATRVHAWVFALQTARTVEEYSPTNVGQWEFRVLANRELLSLPQRSIGLKKLDSLGVRAVDYEGLAGAVKAARRRSVRLGSAPDG